MNTFESFRSQLYQVNERSFDNIALDLFSFQATHNPVYREYLDNLGLGTKQPASIEDIPFMPISFFKQHSVKTGAWDAEVMFNSSGTTGSATSSHFIADLQFYLEHAAKCFNTFFGDLSGFHILALLPSYLERSNSSIVAMIDHFIKQSRSPHSGFYLHDTDKLLNDLAKLRQDENRKSLLFGVSFALLDVAEKYAPDLSHVMIVETGGMKGRRKEITRPELHDRLKKGLHVQEIHSEYGMTELLSQAYTRGNDRFWPSPWMKVVGRDVTDPLQKGLLNETAGINVIDLANWHSICFIETEDLGKIYSDGSFEILGRLDNSDIRGCNLLLS